MPPMLWWNKRITIYETVLDP